MHWADLTLGEMRVEERVLPTFFRVALRTHQGPRHPRMQPLPRFMILTWARRREFAGPGKVVLLAYIELYGVKPGKSVTYAHKIPSEQDKHIFSGGAFQNPDQTYTTRIPTIDC
jgi:hypothetical protein